MICTSRIAVVSAMTGWHVFAGRFTWVAEKCISPQLHRSLLVGTNEHSLSYALDFNFSY